MFECVLFDHGLEKAVTAMVRSGFYSVDYVVEFFHDIAVDDPDAGLKPETVDEDVKRLFAAATDALARETAHWPEMTDNDKLTAAFLDLTTSGIRAEENYGYEASDCGELYSEIRGNPKWKGYCFYHNQDLVRGVLDGSLMIRFSAAVDKPTDEDNSQIAIAVVDALRARGLHPDWDGDPRRTISLPLTWQRRPDVIKVSERPQKDSKPWWKFWE